MLGRRHPRERLVEQDLCTDFDTHRGDVRLALFELEKMGIVERIPNRGAIVRDLKPREVSEIYSVREELEVLAVRILPFPVASADIALEVFGLSSDDVQHASPGVDFADLGLDLGGRALQKELVEHARGLVLRRDRHAGSRPREAAAAIDRQRE